MPRFGLSKADSNAHFVTKSGEIPSWRMEGIELNGAAEYHIHLMYEPFSLMEGQEYIFRFEVRSDSRRTFVLSSFNRLNREQRIGLYGKYTSTTQWQSIEVPFRAATSTDAAVTTFQLGGSSTPIEFRNLEMFHDGIRVAPSVQPPP